MGRLLVSIRGANEAVAAAEGGADIADVEDPISALGTPYPLNIRAVRERLDTTGFSAMPIATNIGEEQPRRSSACQAALGVAIAGADFVKCGFAGMNLAAAAYLGEIIVRTVKEWRPEAAILPAVFPDEEFAVSFDPLTDGPNLANRMHSTGLLIDTYRKESGLGLLDYFRLDQIGQVVEILHADGKEAWVAGSITEPELPGLYSVGVDVVCVRNAASEPIHGEGRQGKVTAAKVARLVAANPGKN